MIRKSLRSSCHAIIYCGLAVLIAACDQPNSEFQESSSINKATAELNNSTAISFTDFNNEIITLDQPAQRIVAMAPHIVENLYTIGAGDRIVGVVDHSDYPEAAKALPMVGGYKKADFERIVALRPDLIVAWLSGNSASNIEKLRELGFTVIIDQPDTLDDVAKSLRMLGAATGLERVANLKAEEFVEQLNQLKQDNISKRKITTFYQVWNEPLISINGKHIISDALEVCGGINVFHNEAATAPRTNIEAVIAKNPEAIIASGMGTARPEWLDDWKQWRTIRAVNRDNLFFVNPDHLQRHTVRQLLAIESICQQFDQARSRS